MPFFRQITTYLSIEFKIKNGAPVFWHRWAWQKSLYRSILSIALTRPRSSSIIPIIIGVVGMIPTRNTLVGCIIQSGSRRGGRPLCRKRKYYVLILRKNFHFFFLPVGLTRPRYRSRFQGSTRQTTRVVVVRAVVAVCVVVAVVRRGGVAALRPRGRTWEESGKLIILNRFLVKCAKKRLLTDFECLCGMY